MRVGIAAKAVWPRFTIHTDPGAIAAGIAKIVVEGQSAGVLVKIDNENTMFAILARIEN